MNKVTRYADIEMRSIGDGENRIEGVAAVFNQPTDMGWYDEVIDARAFDTADMSDVVLNFNHNDDILLAGTRNGSLQLQVTDNGLFQSSKIVSTSQGEDVMKLIREGLISKMSFSFVIDKSDGDAWETRGGREFRTIKKISKLFDVSLVTFPAYGQTAVWSRAKGEDDELAKEHKALMERRAAQDRKLAELLKETNG